MIGNLLCKVHGPWLVTGSIAVSTNQLLLLVMETFSHVPSEAGFLVNPEAKHLTELFRQAKIFKYKQPKENNSVDVYW